jgi:hypothetical protein
VTAGTIFDKTRTPLRVWLAGAWYVTNQKHGANALGLQRVLGLGSYQTAWAMLHRFRQAMVRPDRDKFKGLVEIDETYLAITDKQAPLTAKKRKSRTDKVFAAIAVEVIEPRGFGRIRLKYIADDSAGNVIPFIQDSVLPGSVVRTDGSTAYRSLTALGYEHQHGHAGRRTAGACFHGWCPPRGGTASALDPGHPSRSSPAGTPGCRPQ